MTKILFWNIQKFSNNKMFDPSREHKEGSSITKAEAASDRLAQIMVHLKYNTPDIFVVVEVSSSGGPEGKLLKAGGATGAIGLLNHMRTPSAKGGGGLGKSWCLVPPLSSGVGKYAEGIAVFYNSAKLYFVGPWKWQGAGPSVPVVTAGAATKYPPPFDKALPNRKTHANSPINAGMQENCLAGQYQFRGTDPAKTVLTFPATKHRSPFFTVFYDQPGNRLITLLAYHSTPKMASSGTKRLANIQEITSQPPGAPGPPGPNSTMQVQVVAGDFNVSLFSDKAGAAYGPLLSTPIPYSQAIALNGYTGGNVPPNNAYFITHIKPRKQANAYVGTSSNYGYPGYSYVGSDAGYPGFDAIDNIFYRYLGGAQPPNDHQVTIVNRVVGSPYTNKFVFPPPAIGVPAGTLVYPVSEPPPTPVPTAKNAASQGGYETTDIGARTTFQGWYSYGKIRGTSDHLAVVIEV